MARGDGIDRTNARNMRLTETKIGNTQQHNEREKDSYVNQDIVLERTPLNVHFKTPSAGYREMFARMEADGVISTRGIKEDAFRYGELVFDVNTAYFHNHGGYDFAKQFYTDACNGVQREHNKKLNNGLPILHKVPPKRDYGRYFCIMAEKGGTSHGGLTEKLSPFFHAKKQEVNAYGR